MVSMALVLATAVNERARGPGSAGLRRGPQRGRGVLDGVFTATGQPGAQSVQLVISDAHEGLKEAIQKVLAGTSSQRCRVHFMRNLLAQVPKAMQPMVAAFVRTIFAQPDKASAHAQLAAVAANLSGRFPKAAQLLLEAEEAILASMAFPVEHRRQLHSTTPLERGNREIGRRTGVVGISPNAAAVIRLAGAVLQEQHDECTTASRRYFGQESRSKLYTSSGEMLQSVELLAPSHV